MSKTNGNGKRKLPYLYGQVLTILAGNDILKGDKAAKRNMRKVLADKFRINKRSFDKVMKELSEDGYVTRYGDGSVRIERSLFSKGVEN